MKYNYIILLLQSTRKHLSPQLMKTQSQKQIGERMLKKTDRKMTKRNKDEEIYQVKKTGNVQSKENQNTGRG